MLKEIDKEKEVIRDLGDGLVLRRAGRDDIEDLAAFNSLVHLEPGNEEERDEGVRAWTRDLMNGEHPTTSASDFLVVEDTSRGEIISSMNLISQKWTYAGIEFGVGRPEAVGTAPEYRRRGLVRAQFEVVHAWSAERGELLQIITGIPWYYRQFGYEMGLALSGGRSGYGPAVPKLKDGEEEPYNLREAEAADIPFMAEMYTQATKRSLVACVNDEATWRYYLHGPSEKNFTARNWCVIETPKGERVGLLAYSPRLWGTAVSATFYEVSDGVPWTTVTPTVLRFLWAKGREIGKDMNKELDHFNFHLGAEHPVFDALGRSLPTEYKPYAFYVRVPDVPGFLQHIRPALEQRLKGSVVDGYTGEIKFHFYRDGIRLATENGKLTTIEGWKPDYTNDGDAAVPDLTFLQLLFGYRSLDELEEAFADCWTKNDTTRALLNALFPKQNSNVWPLE